MDTLTRPGGREPARRLTCAARLLLLAALMVGALGALPAATARAQTPQTVPPGWQYIPDGIGVGQSFRLLFVTSTGTTATSRKISTYNTFVQNAANSNTVLRPFKGQFRVLGSTAAVDARDNTATTYTDADKGVPIYWLGGAKVADDYADFYDRSWDSGAAKTESGADVATNTTVGTGTSYDGQKSHAPLGTRQGRVTFGRTGVERSIDYAQMVLRATSTLYRLYASRRSSQYREETPRRYKGHKHRRRRAWRP